MSEGYALVPRTTFNEPWFRNLSERARLVALYVTCGPHGSIVGAVRVPDEYICADLDLPIETVRETVAELIAIGFVKRFGDGRYLLLCRHRQWNNIANPNVFKAALKQLAALPPDPCLSVLFEWLKPYAERFKKGLPNELETIRRRFFLSFAEPFRNTEAEAEAEIEAETETENKAGTEQKNDPETVDKLPVPLKEAAGEKLGRLVADVGGELAYALWFGGAVFDPATRIVIATTAAKCDHIRRTFMDAVHRALGADVRVASAETSLRVVAG